MCARRFLYVVLFLTLLVVAAGFAIYQFGGRVLIKQAVPQGHFAAPVSASAPDYASNSAWLSRPGVGQPASPVADAQQASGASHEAAVFYIHPTTYLERSAWNAPLHDSGDTAFRTDLFLRSQASAFTDLGQVWAPKYRQAAFGAFLLHSEDAQKALDLAYSDVAAAFDRFVAESGDAPIILAGHSQGALHLERLLAEKVAGQPVARRVVAAYVVGWPISTNADLPRLGLPACKSAGQPGCILSWMSFGEPANPDLILSPWAGSKGLTGAERKDGDLLCVNPLTGTEGGTAAPQSNPGTLVPTADLKSATLQAGLVGARCDHGLLLIGGNVPPLGPFVLPGNNYHVYDYALFWAAIRNDAQRRLTAWRH